MHRAPFFRPKCLPLLEYHVDEFTTHLNSLDSNIKFTTEPEQDGRLDGSTHVTVYRKPTHTDQYLNFGSNHHLQHKRSVVRTLMKRAEVMVTRPDCRRKEMAHVQDALKTNGYKTWMFKVPMPKQQQSTTSTGTRPKTNVGLPYMQGTSEALTRVFKAHGVGTYHRPINTIRSMLVHPKDKTPDAQKCGLVYQVECPECSLTYIGETGRMLATRMKDHLNLRNPLTAVGEHCAHEHHTITKDSVRILAREDGWLKRKVREAIEIKIGQPAMNRDQGYELPPIYDELLLSRDRLDDGHVTSEG